MNENLTLKYRPKKFDDIVGQKDIISILKRQVQTNSIKNAYLFSGQYGTGKTSMAKVFAYEVNGAEDSLIEIDAASNNGVDNIRALIDEAQQVSIDYKYKIFCLDECFVEGTLVTTDKGLVPIEKIKVGDTVATLNGFNRVLKTHCKNANNSTLCVVTLNNGNKITTTSNHLFLTTKGWVESKNLLKGDILLDDKNMCKLWEGVSNEPQDSKELQLQVRRGISQKESKDRDDRKNMCDMWECVLCDKNGLQVQNLLSGMQKEINIAIRKKDNELRIWDGIKETIIFKNEGVQSNEQFSSYREDAVKERVEWDSTSMEWDKRGEWEIYSSSNDVVSGIRRFLGIGASNKDNGEEGFRKSLSYVIQSRPWLSRDKIGDRGGWQEPQIEKVYCSRFEEGTMSNKIRVESVEIFEQGSNGEFTNGLTNNTILYDLTVENSPTYFVSGVLVHNCHMLTTQSWNAALKIIEEPPKNCIFIFCTTDPQKIPQTILSRVQRFEFKKISIEDIVKRLAFICKNENINHYDVEALKKIAIISDGHMRDAIKFLQQVIEQSDGDVTIPNVEIAFGISSSELISSLLEYIVKGDAINSYNILDEASKNTINMIHFYDALSNLAMDCYTYTKTKIRSIVDIPSSLLGICVKENEHRLFGLCEKIIGYRKDVNVNNVVLMLKLIIASETR